MTILRQLINLLISSLIATLLPLPINAIDIVIATTSHTHLILNTIFAPIFDTIFAVLTYLLAHQLNRLFKKKLPKITRGNDIALFIASATPAPFTLTIYAIGIIGYQRSLFRFMGIIYIGRLIKYTFLGGAIFLGVEFIQLSWQHWAMIILIIANVLLFYLQRRNELNVSQF